MITLALPALFGYAAWLSRRYQAPSESTFLPISASIMLVLYVAGLGGALLPVAWVLIGGGVVLGLLDLRRFAEPRPGGPFWSPGTVVLLCAVIAAHWWMRHALFDTWDEFSHWGFATKQMVTVNRLPDADGPLIFKDYPPGSALFHYFWLLGRGFSESGAYVAHSVLAFAAMAAVSVRQSILWTLATYAVGFMSLFIFANGLQLLYVDHLVGLWFGGVMASYILSRDRTRLARVLPVLAVLPLIKQVGLLLAIFAAIIVASDTLVRRAGGRRQWAVWLCVLVPLLTAWTWSARLAALDVPRSGQAHASAAQVIEGFTSNVPSRQREMRRIFLTALPTEPVGTPVFGTTVQTFVRRFSQIDVRVNGFGLLQWLAAFAFVTGILIVTHREKNRDELIGLIVCQVWVVVCAAVFAVGLLLLYMFRFTEYEASRLASYSRYLGIPMLGGVTVLWAWTLKMAGWPRSRRIVSVVAGLFVVGVMYAVPSPALRFFREGAAPARERLVETRSRMGDLANRVPTDARVYLVWQGTDGYEYHASRYELALRKTNLGCWSLGAPRFDGDVWTCTEGVSAWQAALHDFDYVVLGRTDDLFWDEFGELFDVRDGLLYKVDAAGRLIRQPTEPE